MSLTPRQKQIAALVARGTPNKRIARATGLSMSAVKAYIQNGAKRIPVSSRIHEEAAPRDRLLIWFLDLRRKVR